LAILVDLAINQNKKKEANKGAEAPFIFHGVETWGGVLNPSLDTNQRERERERRRPTVGEQPVLAWFAWSYKGRT